MNIAQKIGVAVTILAVAVFLFVGGHRYGDFTDPRRTFMDALGILLVGGVVTWLLGIIKRKRRPTEDLMPEGENRAVNAAQKTAIALTMIAVAVYVIRGGYRTPATYYEQAYTDWGITAMCIVGVLLIGVAGMVLLGIRRKQARSVVAQRTAVAVTLSATTAVVFYSAWAYGLNSEWASTYRPSLVRYVAGILLIGGATVLMLGIKRKPG